MQQGFAPPDHEEKKNLDNLLEMLQEVGSNDNGRTSLAASAARMWASFLDDNWTWEGRFLFFLYGGIITNWCSDMAHG
jgi:hypothetical protein